MAPMSYHAMAALMGMDDTQLVGEVLLDQLELRDGAGALGGDWEGQAWYGGDLNKLWLKSEGEWPSAQDAQGRVELLWDRIVSRWWNLQAGARYDFGRGPGKGWAALGVQGLAPFWLDIEATLYAGEAGAFGARLKAETDLLLTQRWILQPQIELNAYTRADRALEQGAEVSNIESGLRLRYEIRHELAPYLGVGWTRQVAPVAQAAQPIAAWQLLAGVRFWF